MRHLRFSTFLVIGLAVALTLIPSSRVSAAGGVNASFTWNPVYPAAGQDVYFNDTSTTDEGVIVEWEWDFGDGGTSIERDVNHAFTEPGQYIVTLSVTTSKGR